MKKTLTRVFVIIGTILFVVASGVLGFFANDWFKENHECNYATEYSYNKTSHWRECKDTDLCDKYTDYAAHVGMDEDNICDVCLYGSKVLVNGVNYDTLQDAVNSYTDEPITLTLFEDTIDSGLVVDGQEIIIDLNGKTYTPDEAVGSAGTKTIGFQFLKGSKVTIKNGTLKAGEEGIKMLIQNYADLTLENVTLDGRGLIGTGANQTGANYVLSNNCGNITIKGNTTIIADEGDYAFDAYYYHSGGYIEGVTVSFADFTGSIQGKVQVDGNFVGAPGQAKIVKPDGTELTENGIYEI